MKPSVALARVATVSQDAGCVRAVSSTPCMRVREKFIALCSSGTPATAGNSPVSSCLLAFPFSSCKIVNYPGEPTLR